MASADEIRATFLGYFERHDHEVVASSPLVPSNDPTLLFTNAGMVQFKNVFVGAEQSPYLRAVTSQKCLRAGGKHNDLENVGYTVRHHTFFEMLGNFSFGDYFKDGAIELAWNFVTKELGLPGKRLLVTVFAEDDDAYELWRKIAGLDDSRIIRIPTSDNFWSMGETGSCGPCSEIFYDHGPEVPGGPPGSADGDGDRFVEIWNLVFMQYDQVSADERVELPKPSIDTGMGLERIAAVLQGKRDVYDTDLLRALVVASSEVSGTDVDGTQAVSHRVIADHLRACSFLLAEGVLPSNEGRGYVLRRIMRRAMRHAHLLGCEEPMVWRLVPTLVQLMGQVFPELSRAEALITETLKLEESRFKMTLGRGLKLLDDAILDLKPEAEFDGEVAFRLYDTYGFPLDLTQDILRGQGRRLNTEAFDRAMDRQRAEARKAWSGSGDSTTDEIWFDVRDTVVATEFLGYGNESVEALAQALLVNGTSVTEVGTGGSLAIVTNQTPFYGEAGGQIGDTGILLAADGTEIVVEDTQRRLEDLIVHMGRVTKGTLRVGDTLEMRVDSKRRVRLRANHSVTHLLHEALRRQLGDHVAQKGSLIAPDSLRFDFSHQKPMSDEDIAAVEREVNARIRENTLVTTRLMAPEDAAESGALALFGEKYGEEVRVVSMGGEQARPFSTELCGGTHVERTGDIGFFKITQESSVASGIRRVEALTGEAALSHVESYQRIVIASAALTNVAIIDVPGRVGTLVEDKRRLERELSEMRRKLVAGGDDGSMSVDREIGGIVFASRKLDDIPPKELKPLVDSMKDQIGSGVVVVVAVNDGTASIVVGVTADLVGRISALDLVRVGSAVLGGKGGGGRPDMAQAGGPNGDAAKAAIVAVEIALAALT
jgi:alanyl-tRNA synthetase